MKSSWGNKQSKPKTSSSSAPQGRCREIRPATERCEVF